MSGLGDILFGSGGGSSSESKQAGIDVASSFGLTGAESSSSSSGVAKSSQQIAFEDLFRKLYGGASTAAAGVDTGAISTAAKSLFSSGSGFLETLAGNQSADQLAAIAGDTTARDSQLAVLKSTLGDFFNQSLLPAITREGVSTGTLGGSRDAIAKELAAKAVAGQFSTGAANIISSDQAQRLQAAGKAGDLTIAGAGTGLNALQSLYGLSSGAELSDLAPFQALASIFGGPTTLTESSSVDLADAISSSFGQQGSQSYGYNYGTSKGTSKGATQGLAQAFLSGGGLSI